MTTPSNGVRHFRGTPSMWTLSPAESRALEVIRYLAPDEAPTIIPQATIARHGNISQSTVNRAVKVLEARGFISVRLVARTDVQGMQWEITSHMLPEVAANGGTWHGSLSDQPVPAPPQRMETRQTPIARSVSDQHEDHDQYQQQQHDPAPKAPALSASQVLLYNALRAAGADHSPALAQVHKTPDRTPDDVARQLQAAEARPSTKIAIALLLHCWSSGEWITPPRARPQAPEQEATPPNEKGPTDGAHQPRRPAARPARARAAKRTGHDQIPADFGFAEFYAFAQQFADPVNDGGGGDVPAV